MTDGERARLAAEYGDEGKPVRVSAPSRGKAVLLGLLATGLGHVYAGDLRRGLAWWGGILSWMIGSTWLGLWDRFGGLVVGLVVALALWVASLVDAARVAGRERRHGGTGRKWFQRWWVYGAYFLVSVSIAPLARSILPLQAFRLPTGSMAPALIPGDHLMARKVYGDVGEIARGDLVIYRDSGVPQTLRVHRVLGLPGEVLEIVGGEVHVDGEAIEDPWAWRDGPPISPVLAARLGLSDSGPFRVPEDSIFLMGDNRDRAVDSRMEGPVPLDSVHALPLYVYWHPHDRGRIGLRVE